MSRPLLRLAVYAAGLLAVFGLSQCAQQQRRENLTLKGSDTMVILGQRWAEKYMAAHPGSIVEVTGGGSGTGVAALINGTTDICQSSRPMKEAEVQQIEAKFGAKPHEQIVARDGLAIYVHEASSLRELTLEQAKGIYAGTITNWKAVGGPDAPIVPYGRENNSGTYAYFKEHVLAGGDFAANVQTLPGTAAVVNAVSKDPNGVGYGGDAYAKGVRLLALAKDASTPAVVPEAASIHDGSYPLARPLYFYTRKAPEGPAKAFIDYCLSAEGQAVVTEVGYFPVQ